MTSTVPPRAVFIDRRSVPGLDEGARLLATGVTHDARRAVLVVGATRENRAEALRSLRTALLLLGPIARSQRSGRPHHQRRSVRLEQAMSNLVDNALRHGHGTVVIEARPNHGATELHVRDQGPGLPKEFIPRAFDRFSRADEAHAGAGLEPAIVHAIAVAHDGTAHVRADTDPADIWISLPADPMTR